MSAYDSGVEEFYEKHVAGGPTHVVAAIVVMKGGGCDFAVFSTLAKAREWGHAIDDDRASAVVYSPYIVDVPEYGNVPKGQRQ